MSFLSQRNSKGGSKSPAFGNELFGGEKKGMFSDIEIHKDLIIPGVTHREERSLEKIQDFVREKTGEECTLPQHIINDVYSMYVNEDFKRRDVNGKNAVKQKIIDKVYNSLTKEITKGSSLFSQIVTKELSLYMQMVQRKIEEEQEKQEQQGKMPGGACPKGSGIDQGMPSMDKPGKGNEGNEEGEAPGQPSDDQEDDGDEGEGSVPGGKAPGDGSDMGGSGDLDQEDQSKMDSIDDILEDTSKDLDKAMQNAADTIQDLEEKLGKDVLDDLANSEPDFMEKMDGIKDALSRVSFDKANIKLMLMKILNESRNYFSKNFDTIEESIFETEDFDDLFGLEYLDPIFQMAGLMNVGNASRVYKGKMDLYLDCSGSMGSRKNIEGTNIRLIDLVKGVAMMLFRMNMIDKLYFFDGGMYEIERINEFTILAFDKSGGTNFNMVVDQCMKNGRNSVVITDGQDSVEKYIKNVFWVGVGGTDFSGGYSGHGAFEQYRANGQCVTYDHNSKSGKFIKCN